MANVLVEEQSLQDIANAIREVTSTEDKLKPSEMGNAQRNFAKGLIDQANATTGKEDTDLTSAVGSLVEGFGGGSGDIWQYATFSNGAMFKYSTFPENTEIQMKIKGRNDSSFTFMFFDSNIYSIKFETENSTQITANGMCQACGKLVSVYFLNEEIGFINTYQLFGDCKKLKTVSGKINLSSAYNVSNMFYLCEALEDVEFTPLTITLSISFAHSSKLSDASIQSIIDGLADLTGKTAQTLTLHADVKAKLTETQLTTITNKNWTLA